MADDHPMHLIPVGIFIEQEEGIKVVAQGTDGSSLIEKMVVLDELPNVCLLDINMEPMDGFQTLVEIKKRWPQIYCLILTAFPDDPNIIQMIRLGANGFLIKSMGPAEVVKAIKAVMEHGYYYSNVANETTYNLVKDNKVKMQELNPREIEFLKYTCTDLTYPEIAAEMKSTPKAITGLRDRLCEKLDVDSRVSLALTAVALKLYIPNAHNYLKRIR